MKQGGAVSDAGDRIGGIISLNLENCENPLARTRAGQLTTVKLDFADCSGYRVDVEIESRRIKVSGAADTVSVSECSRRRALLRKQRASAS